MLQNKEPRNEKRQRHGLWIEYDLQGKLILKGNYINGKRYGRWDNYYPNNSFFIRHYVDNEDKGYQKFDLSGKGDVSHNYIAR